MWLPALAASFLLTAPLRAKPLPSRALLCPSSKLPSSSSALLPLLHFLVLRSHPASKVNSKTASPRKCPVRAFCHSTLQRTCPTRATSWDIFLHHCLLIYLSFRPCKARSPASSPALSWVVDKHLFCKQVRGPRTQRLHTCSLGSRQHVRHGSAGKHQPEEKTASTRVRCTRGVREAAASRRCQTSYVRKAAGEKAVAWARDRGSKPRPTLSAHLQGRGPSCASDQAFGIKEIG